MSSRRFSAPSEVFGGFCSLLGLPLGHISAGLPLFVQSAYSDSPAAWRSSGYASAFFTARTRTSLQFSHVTSFPLTIFRGLFDASGMLLSTAPHRGDLCLVPALTTRCLTRDFPISPS
jgi:hypothetical protein